MFSSNRIVWWATALTFMFLFTCENDGWVDLDWEATVGDLLSWDFLVMIQSGTLILSLLLQQWVTYCHIEQSVFAVVAAAAENDGWVDLDWGATVGDLLSWDFLEATVGDLLSWDFLVIIQTVTLILSLLQQQWVTYCHIERSVLLFMSLLLLSMKMDECYWWLFFVSCRDQKLRESPVHIWWL